jgi:putative hydroxymethylpyrimidine transporter CytX
MVLFRPVLGVRGSAVPSALNILQLIGWTGFEFWAMAQVADRMSRRLFHASSYWPWLAVVVVLCTLLALGGPILVVRQWLEKFGAWVVAAVAAWITARVLATASLAAVWHQPGQGGMTFWLGVDLVVAMPISWVPLVADYNRFARKPRGSVAGTFVGYAIGNAWFYALGALLVLSAGLPEASPGALGDGIARLAGGWVVLLALLVGETDEAFADIYSAAVSSQNILARVRQRGAILAVAAAGTALAVWLGLRPSVALGTYQSFLLLMGSVFVPLFGVFVADYFLLGRRGAFAREDLFDGSASRRPLNGPAILAWAVGFLIYQWSVPTGPQRFIDAMHTLLHSWLRLPFPLAGSAAGASIPSFAAALALYAAIEGLSRSRHGPRAAGPPPPGAPAGRSKRS